LGIGGVFPVKFGNIYYLTFSPLAILQQKCLDTSGFKNGVFVHKMADDDFQTRLVQTADSHF